MNKIGLIAEYQDKLLQHGPGPQAVQWADRASQYARFEILGVAVKNAESVLDIGCGLGEFCHYLRKQKSNAEYTGIEIVPEFVTLARENLIADTAATVIQMDADIDVLPEGKTWVVTSGMFNNKMENNWRFMTQILKKMYTAADIGIAFNAMSTSVEYRAPGLWYVDPIDVFAFCKNDLGGHPILRHDYVTRPGGFPFEFTIYVYKSPCEPGKI
jgi:SAM-dependent methyltransferase